MFKPANNVASAARPSPAVRDSGAMIRWFQDIDRNAAPEVGGKGANLGEIARAGLPVPAGFVVTVRAYRSFVEQSKLDKRAAEIVSRIDVDTPASLRNASRDLRDLVAASEIPEDVRAAILDAYKRLANDGDQKGDNRGDLAVAIRSSAPSEDTAQFSFAGMFDSFLGVRGTDDVLRRVRDCWASTFGERVLFYRVKQGQPPDQPLAVVVQRMVNAEKAGVLFTVDPATQDADRIVIEAAWGLGEVVVAGKVTPDRYVIDKSSLGVLEAKVARKEFMLAIDERSGEQRRIDLSADERGAKRVLEDAELRTLAELAKKTEAHYGAPQDIEFAASGGSIVLVQTRPITTLASRSKENSSPDASPGADVSTTRPPARDSAESQPSQEPSAPAGQLLVRGRGASPGVATGAVRVLSNARSSGDLQQGDVLVAPMTSPDWVPAMRRAAAIVTDSGGTTSHAAIVSRELGIPCVVGAGDATTKLKDGMRVTVDGGAGTVQEAGAGQPNNVEPSAETRNHAGQKRTGPSSSSIVTATRLYVNLAEPELADDIARRDVDGVGLLRAEFMLLSALDNTHPKRFLEQQRGEEFVQRMKDKVILFARAFHPRPVIYRTTDFRSNEFRGLAGGDQYEPEEQNPMIGYRGCFRYTHEPELFALELRVLHEVRAQFDNLHLMIPFVRTKGELAACLRLVDESPLGDDTRLERWVMAEVPSIVHWLPTYAALGISGVSIGSNDLTQLVLGVDRDSAVLAPLYDERDPAVLSTIESIITSCRRLGLTCSICGQAPSVHADYAERLVRLGIDSISVNPDSLERTRRHIAAAEQRLLLEHARAMR
jgi:pyruvate,water dikinase